MGSFSAAIGRMLVPKPVALAPGDRDTAWWIARSEEFAKRHLKAEVILQERFAIPAELPWGLAIPVFDPGNLTNRGMVNSIKGVGVDVHEEADVMKYRGSEACGAPTLHFINGSNRPDQDTVGLSPKQLRGTGKNYLGLRGYGLASAVYFFATREHLDPETFTWFPEISLSGGDTAYGYGDPDGWGSSNGEVDFRWYSPGPRYYGGGARMAVSVPLKS